MVNVFDFRILERDPAKRPSASESLKIPFIAKQMMVSFVKPFPASISIIIVQGWIEISHVFILTRCLLFQEFLQQEFTVHDRKYIIIEVYFLW